MKFLRIMRVPQYKRFHITPRYYDPIKEDIEIRTAKIKSEMEQSKNGQYISNIRGSFRANVTRDSKSGYLSSRDSKAAFIRLIIFVILIGGIVGYLLIGSDMIYGLYLFVPVYAYFRLKGRWKRS